MKMFLCAVSIVISACLIGTMIGSVGANVTAQTLSKFFKGG